MSTAAPSAPVVGERVDQNLTLAALQQRARDLYAALKARPLSPIFQQRLVARGHRLLGFLLPYLGQEPEALDTRFDDPTVENPARNCAEIFSCLCQNLAQLPFEYLATHDPKQVVLTRIEHYLTFVEGLLTQQAPETPLIGDPLAERIAELTSEKVLAALQLARGAAGREASPAPVAPLGPPANWPDTVGAVTEWGKQLDALEPLLAQLRSRAGSAEDLLREVLIIQQAFNALAPTHPYASAARAIESDARKFVAANATVLQKHYLVELYSRVLKPLCTDLRKAVPDLDLSPLDLPTELPSLPTSADANTARLLCAQEWQPGMQRVVAAVAECWIQNPRPEVYELHTRLLAAAATVLHDLTGGSIQALLPPRPWLRRDERDINPESHYRFDHDLRDRFPRDRAGDTSDNYRARIITRLAMVRMDDQGRRIVIQGRVY